MKTSHRVERLTDSERGRLRWLVRAAGVLAALGIALGILIDAGTITGVWPAVTFSTLAVVGLAVMGFGWLIVHRARRRESRVPSLTLRIEINTPGQLGSL